MMIEHNAVKYEVQSSQLPTEESEKTGLKNSMLCSLCIKAEFLELYKLYADKNWNW